MRLRRGTSAFDPLWTFAARPINDLMFRDQVPSGHSRTFKCFVAPSRLLLVLASLAGMLSACGATARRSSLPSEIFAHPAAYVGRDVTVCGFLTRGNLIERKNRWRLGLNTAAVDGDVEEAVLNRWETSVCVDGTIFHAGCSTIPCHHWVFDYGINIRSVRSC